MKLTKPILCSLITEVMNEAITGTGLHNLVSGRSLYDVEQEMGLEQMLNAAYVSGQRGEAIEDLDAGDPWFQETFALLQNEWNKGRSWADEKNTQYNPEMYR